MSFDDDLTTASEAPIEFEDVDVLIGGNLHTLRFLQLVGGEWAAEGDRHPARPGVLLDQNYGFNIRSLTKAVAVKTGRRLEADGALVELSPEQWDRVWRAIDGNTQGRIDDAIFRLNEAGPLARVNRKKAELAAATE